MRTNLSTLWIDNSVAANGCGVWHRLHSEREEICGALLKKDAPSYESSKAMRMSTGDAMGAGRWHRELLQARLHKIDNALDRLMAGSYGNCAK